MKAIKSGIAFEVLSYLYKHPNAQDTVEGIAQWWIMERQINQTISDVEKALALLCSKRWIIAIQIPDSNILYKINKQKIKDIKNLIESNNT
ncbi:MAG: hypothetical protein ACMUIU_11020 [bacterium]